MQILAQQLGNGGGGGGLNLGALAALATLLSSSSGGQNSVAAAGSNSVVAANSGVAPSGGAANSGGGGVAGSCACLPATGYCVMFVVFSSIPFFSFFLFFSVQLCLVFLLGFLCIFPLFSLSSYRFVFSFNIFNAIFCWLALGYLPISVVFFVASCLLILFGYCRLLDHYSNR